MKKKKSTVKPTNPPVRKEGRLKENVTLIKDVNTDIDQMSSGLNFVTTRPKKEILSDYAMILNFIYDPVNYYKRLTYMGLSLKRNAKYIPDFATQVKMVRAFLRLCYKEGFKRETGLLYWKLLFTILFKNPKAIELVMGLAALYIHFRKHSQFIIKLTNDKILNMNTLDNESTYQSSP
jgi:hypothetical protein